jgi:hypothetical protein
VSRMHLRIPRFPAAAITAACLAAALLLAQPMAAEAATPKPARVVVAGYSGDQLANARVIVRVAAARNLPLAAAVLGVTAAMGESSLRNLTYGDNAINPDGTVADSIGLFQQQHWWGSHAERMTPSYAAGAFFAHLVRVHGWRSMTPTAAIHAVQGNADPQYYTRFVPAAVAVVAYLVQHPGAARSATKPVPRGSTEAKAPEPTGTKAQKHAGGGSGAEPAKGSTSSPAGTTAKQPSYAADTVDELFPANGGIDLKGLAADVAAASGAGDWSTADWTTEWDLGSADEAIAGAFTDGLGSAGGTIPDVPVPEP